MFTTARFVLGFVALSLALPFLGTSIARADDAVPKAAPTPQVAFIVIKSMTAATDFVKKTGIDVPPEASAKGIEAQFPFIGDGGLDADKPIGIAVCGGADLSTGQSMAFCFPVKPTAITTDAILKMGAVAMPGHPDTFVKDGVGFRRTADYLIFSPNPSAAASVNIAAMAGSVNGADALARLFIDFKTLRTELPDAYQAMMKGFESGATQDAKTKADKEASLMFVKPMMKMMDTVEVVTVGLDNGDNGTRLSITGAPLKILTAAATNLPGMPDGVIARIDTNFATTDSSSAIRSQIQKAFNTGLTEDSTLSPEKKKQAQALGDQVGGMLFDAATNSIGVEMIDGAPAIYMVQHWTKPIDAAQEWKRITADLMAILGTEKEKVSTETYTEDALTVTRIIITSDETVRMDIAQRENDVYMSFSLKDTHLIHGLLAPPAEGPMKGVLSGSVDLAKAVEAMSKIPNSPVAGMPPELRKKITDILAGQKIAIATSAVGDEGTLEITVTKGLLESIPKLMQVLNPPEAKPDAK